MAATRGPVARARAEAGKHDAAAAAKQVKRGARGKATRSRDAQRTHAAPPLSRGDKQLIIPEGTYCESIHQTRRRPTRTVWVGKVPVGSEHPIARQTMTTTDTKDVDATVDQVMRCADAGADIVRITVQGNREAEACMAIREKLFQLNYDTPLVADIHFNPRVALRVADAFEKIRVNPGNFADGTKKFETYTYESQAEYDAEVEHIQEMFTPLVEKCKKLGRAIRIGTNHGSLSARILSFYGDTPKGMVRSAFEFADVCRNMDYHNFLFSMKASNPIVMVQAYRLLAAEMYSKGWDYPLHLGVTEAGEGEDGRMKSAIGIGTLLLDGLGDTIRVSLTEDPELEMEPCSRLALLGTQACDLGIGTDEPFVETHRDFSSFDRRKGVLPPSSSSPVENSFHRDGSVFSVVTLDDLDDPDRLYSQLGTKSVLGLPFKDIATSDSIILTDVPDASDHEKMLAIRRLVEGDVGLFVPLEALRRNPIKSAIAIVTMDQALAGAALPEGVEATAITLTGEEDEKDIERVLGSAQGNDKIVAVFLKIRRGKSRVHHSRKMFELLAKHDVTLPVLHHEVFAGEDLEKDDIIIQGGSECGSLLVDGLGDGIVLEGPAVDIEFLRLKGFGILQGCRMRNIKTDYVSCPSCGRTLFDLQEVTAAIQEKTGHLPGVSIAVMGCIVNGPGEMADADFGYVGQGPGKIDLYVGKEVVRRNIPMENAVDQLVDLIKEHDRWIEPTAPEPVAA